MSDLSWLNPTPHAIAVYASCAALPPPHATLASRRPATALPGPDLHRLIAPALPGAFTHSITSSARASKVGGTSMPRALTILWLITSSYFTLIDPTRRKRHHCYITASSSQESLATRYLPNRAVAQDQGLQESEGVYQANIKCQCSFRHQASMDSRHKILFGVR